MSDVLIRDVPPNELDVIRAAASAQGVSVQRYLRDSLHAQVMWIRRQEALQRAEERLRGRPAVSEEDRDAVLDAMDAATDERAAELADRAHA